jgi:formate dehydrogenase maturation protein FdhE
MKMSVSCPTCGSKSVDSKAKKTMYNEIVQYYECSFCRIPFIACRHLGKINRIRNS